MTEWIALINKAREMNLTIEEVRKWIERKIEEKEIQNENL
jgi:hypothetical protein